MPNTEITINSTNGVVLATEGKYCDKNIEVSLSGKENIIAENIKKDVEFLGMTGSFEGEGIEEVATASAMTALLVAANVGKTYKFVGTTDSNYTNGDLYEVELSAYTVVVTDNVANTTVVYDGSQRLGDGDGTYTITSGTMRLNYIEVMNGRFTADLTYTGGVSGVSHIGENGMYTLTVTGDGTVTINEA